LDQLQTSLNLSSGVRETLNATLAVGTKRQYFAYWRKFSGFLYSRRVPPKHCTLTQVLDFLQLYRDKNVSFSTIKIVAAALQFHLIRLGLPHLFSSVVFHDYMRGAKRLAPLPRPSCATWNPAIPLQFIRNSPLTETFLPTAREALFLLILALGIRVDDASKLGCCTSDIPQGLRLFFVDKRKCPINGQYSSHVDVFSFNEHPRLCPVLAIQRFLRVAAVIRKDDKFLFISSTGKRAAVFTLRRWICDVLQQSGITASAGSCRSSSTSTAFYTGVPIDGILKSAGWSKEDTFRKFYFKPVHGISQPLYANAISANDESEI
jgi:hypothetical protein